MPEIVVTEFMDESARAWLAARFRVRYAPELAAQREALAATLGQCRALIVRNRTRVDADLLALAPQLRAVGRLGVGVDNIDVEACHRRGIEVLLASGANAASVAEYVIGGLVLLLRGAYRASAEVLAGRWPREASIGREAAGKTLGLVGFGATAREVARRAACLGMTMVGCDPEISPGDPTWRDLNVAPRDFTGVVRDADVLSLHVPLLPGTRHLIDDAALALMKPDAVLINTSRGGIVDENALAQRLRAGRLGGALLDVFEAEPLPAGSVLSDVPNLILTPHVAGVSVESNRRVSMLTAENVARALGVEP